MLDTTSTDTNSTSPTNEGPPPAVWAVGLTVGSIGWFVIVASLSVHPTAEIVGFASILVFAAALIGLHEILLRWVHHDRLRWTIYLAFTIAWAVATLVLATHYPFGHAMTQPTGEIP